MSKFPVIDKYLADRANPPAIEKIYSIRLGWIRKIEDREITMYAWFTEFARGECQKSNQPNLAVPMTENLARKVLHRVLSKFPKASIEDSFSMDLEIKSELHQVGFVNSLEAVRDSVRNAIGDGFSREEILAVCSRAVNG